MRFYLMHVDESDEVAVLLPGEAKVAVLTETRALPPLVERLRGVIDDELPVCSACGEDLPGLRLAE